MPKVLDRIRSIYRLTARKQKMDTERTITKLKMNASINGSFCLVTPRKSRPAPKYVCLHPEPCVSEFHRPCVCGHELNLCVVFFQIRT